MARKRGGRMMQEFINDVSVERWRYIGGSDIPIIMDLSPFKSREELLREKAMELDSDFEGNAYTDYGHEMEPKIRAHINQAYGYHFAEYREITEDDCRIHLDGFQQEPEPIVLEVKTTSRIKETEEDYIAYKVQILFYMMKTKARKGILAIYDRPDDFNSEFDEERLSIIVVEDDEENAEIKERIANAVIDFKSDIARLKANPNLTCEELIPEDLQEFAHKYQEAKRKADEYKKEAELLGNLLIDAMRYKGRKSLKFDQSGFRITRTEAKSERTEIVNEFDFEWFKNEHPEMIEQYTKPNLKTTSARKASLRITKQ